jgi:hypothetical protein
MHKKKDKKKSQEVDSELEAKGRDAQSDFDDSQALFVPARNRESKLISIRLPISMIKELRAVAIKKGDIGYQQLIKIFIADGLLKSGTPATPYALNSVQGAMISTQGSSTIRHLQVRPSVSGDVPMVV